MLLHTGTFDVENYGDLLFPALLQRRFPQDEIIHVSPAGSLSLWNDTVPCRPLDTAAGLPARALVIGGGNILQAMPTTLPFYRRAAVDLTGYADLWIVPTLSAPPEMPVIWNAPGVPGYFETPFIPIVREAVLRADYLAVRDVESREMISEIAPNRHVRVVPDPAWELPALWPATSHASALQATLARLGAGPDTRFFVTHVNRRYISDLEPAQLADEIDGLAAAFEARPLLAAIGPCHGDTGTARQVAHTLRSDPLVLASPRSLHEMAALIAGAVAYVGSSMHGYITAAAYGVPAIVIARGKPK